MSFTTQSAYYAGSTTGYDGNIVQLLVDGQKSVIARLEAMNPDILHLFSAETAVANGSGVSLPDHSKVLNVRRGSYRAVPVNVQHKDLISDSGSIYFALPQSPAYYIDKALLYIKPDPTGVSGNGGTVDRVTYGAINDGASTIASFPSEYYQAIVLYVAKGLLHMKLVQLQEALPDDFDSDQTTFDIIGDFALSNTGYFATAPAVPAVPDFGDVGDIDPEGHIEALGTAPVYTKPTLGVAGGNQDVLLPTYPLTHGTDEVDLTAANALIELLPTQDLDLLGPYGISTDEADFPTYTPPTIGLVGASPDVVIPVLAGLPTLNLTDTNALIDIDLDTELEAPALSSAITIGGLGTVPEYTAPTVASITSVAGTDLLDMVQGAINTDADQIDFAKWWDVLADYIEDEEDTELAALQAQKIGTYIQAFGAMVQKYSAEMQNAVSVFNKENAIYASTVQKAVQNAQLADSYDAKILQKWQGLVAQHQQQVSQALLDYKTQYDAIFQKWQFDYTQKMQEYSIAVQGAVNTFNANNAKYQGKLQVATQEAQLKDSNEAKKLQQHSQKMQEYQSQLNISIQAWQLENQKQIEEWQGRYTNKMQEYSIALQNELNVFNGEQAEYQALLQKKMGEYQAKAQRLISQGNNQLSREVQEYSNSLGRYQAELGQYQADLAKEVQIYSTNLGKNLQAFQAAMGKDTLSYQWLQGQLQWVTQLYEQFFQPYSMDSPEDTTHVGVTR